MQICFVNKMNMGKSASGKSAQSCDQTVQEMQSTAELMKYEENCEYVYTSVKTIALL